MTLSYEDLIKASNKVEYHVSMFVKTYRWLKQKETWENAALPKRAFYTFRYLPRSIQWLVPVGYRNLTSNSVEDSHLAHARILYEFLAKEKQERFKKTDIRASDFNESETDYALLEDGYLKEWNENIGGRGFHLTTTHLTAKISDWEWPFDEIAEHLLHPLRDYFSPPSAPMLRRIDRKQCLEHLDLLASMLSEQ